MHGFNDIDEIEWPWFPTICLDIDECKVGTDLVSTHDDDGKICPPNSDCFNTEGSYECNCAKGPEFVNHSPVFDLRTGQILMGTRRSTLHSTLYP